VRQVKDKRVAADRLATFKEHLRRQGLKSTAQRNDIVRIFFASNAHRSVEELYAAVKRVNPGIGYATVYRTMKLLAECGLAVERHFRDGEARYESAVNREHHDHVICEHCGKIVEFEEPRIEALQEQVARRLGFRLSGHKMELYGRCPACQRGQPAG
jgi:Fur family ferric uptake transcriptional regulator